MFENADIVLKVSISKLKTINAKETDTDKS